MSLAFQLEQDIEREISILNSSRLSIVEAQWRYGCVEHSSAAKNCDPTSMATLVSKNEEINSLRERIVALEKESNAIKTGFTREGGDSDQVALPGMDKDGVASAVSRLTTML